MGHLETTKKIIKEFEGLKLTSYLCPTGHWTIGYGHTSSEIVEGMTITIEKAEEYLEKDISYFSGVVKKFVKVPLNDNQLSALISFVFNLGDQRLKKSTLLKKLNESDYVGASKEFIRWNKGEVDGVLTVIDGLTTRRVIETKIFTTV